MSLINPCTCDFSSLFNQLQISNEHDQLFDMLSIALDCALSREVSYLDENTICSLLARAVTDLTGEEVIVALVSIAALDKSYFVQAVNSISRFYFTNSVNPKLYASLADNVPWLDQLTSLIETKPERATLLQFCKDHLKIARKCVHTITSKTPLTLVCERLNPLFAKTDFVNDFSCLPQNAETLVATAQILAKISGSHSKYLEIRRLLTVHCNSVIWFDVIKILTIGSRENRSLIWLLNIDEYSGRIILNALIQNRINEELIPKSLPFLLSATDISTYLRALIMTTAVSRISSRSILASEAADLLEAIQLWPNNNDCNTVLNAIFSLSWDYVSVPGQRYTQLVIRIVKILHTISVDSMHVAAYNAIQQLTKRAQELRSISRKNGHLAQLKQYVREKNEIIEAVDIAFSAAKDKYVVHDFLKQLSCCILGSTEEKHFCFVDDSWYLGTVQELGRLRPSLRSQ